MILEPLPWSQQLADFMGSVLGSENEAAELERQAESGRVQCWMVDRSGILLTRLECIGDARELVLVAAKGDAGPNTWDALRWLARRVGAASMRAHSSRKGMGRYLGRQGFQVAETVYRAYI